MHSKPPLVVYTTPHQWCNAPTHKPCGSPTPYLYGAFRVSVVWQRLFNLHHDGESDVTARPIPFLHCPTTHPTPTPSSQGWSGLRSQCRTGTMRLRRHRRQRCSRLGSTRHGKRALRTRASLRAAQGARCCFMTWLLTVQTVRGVSLHFCSRIYSAQSWLCERASERASAAV